jgi:C4-dicarboxylate-specific signal transduction histidine kinase
LSQQEVRTKNAHALTVGRLLSTYVRHSRLSKANSTDNLGGGHRRLPSRPSRTRSGCFAPQTYRESVTPLGKTPELQDLQVIPMTTDIRRTGIDVVGDMVAWGAHFCLFYETKEDLLDTLISYCKSGLERDEYCLWIVAEPLTIDEARDALKDAVSNLDQHLADSRLEITPAREWFLQGGTFDGARLTSSWYRKLAEISAKGYAGMRITGDTTWLANKDWNHFCDYEDGLNEVIGNRRLAVLCTYPLAGCGAPQILDVVRTHQFMLARRHGNWDVVETAALKRAKAELNQLNDELERRVVERTGQLLQTSEALQQAQAELAHVNRVTTMGQLAASISHEVMQPIAAGITNAQAALRWLDAQPPNLEEVRQALGHIVNEGNRAGDVIDRIRALVKKAPARNDPLLINEAIREVIALTHGELVKQDVSVQTQLAEDLPLIQGDRVQLQQVILNLIINAVEAMSGVGKGSRGLLITTGQEASGGVLVSVRDSGPGLGVEDLDRLFDAFYTTKPGGMGMGLSICRSIIEAYEGEIWASRNVGPGATFQVTLPVVGAPAA